MAQYYETGNICLITSHETPFLLAICWSKQIWRRRESLISNFQAKFSFVFMFSASTCIRCFGHSTYTVQPYPRVLVRDRQSCAVVTVSLSWDGPVCHCQCVTVSIPANTKHLYNMYTTSAQRLRRWSNIVYMLYKCFMFTGYRPCWTTNTVI